MSKIKLFHTETYPCEINSIRKRLQNFPDTVKRELKNTEFLSDYTSSALWNTKLAFGSLHQELMQCLEQHEIVVYHNTRLPNKNSVEKLGLIFSDDRYIKMLQETLLSSDIEKSITDEVINIVIHERDRWEYDNENHRKNEVCFIYDMDYYKAYDKFLAVYGGEFMEFGLSSFTMNHSLSRYKKIIKIGHPYVVEFSIPSQWMHKFEKQDVARILLEEWIHIDIRNDATAHQYDGRIESEIPSEKIIKIHEVDDCFPEMDKWLFRDA